MTAESLPRVLCVDDEQNILDGLTRSLRNAFSVETALGGEAGLALLKTKEPFAVIVSDFRMPHMSGAEFLAAARQIAPDSVRVLLTGQAGLDGAIAAVNDGNIFRFLAKPCPNEVLIKSLTACVEQYRLVTSEKVLLGQTLHGSIKALTDVLALSNPEAFGRATRIRRMVSELMADLGMPDRWAVEVACMLSQIGCVALPPKLQEKLYKGELLNKEEMAMAERASRVTEQLLANIPRLEPVREILRLHERRYAGAKDSADGITGDAIPWGARALKIVLDFDYLTSHHEAKDSLNVLCSREGWYDPAILKVFVDSHGGQDKDVKFCDLRLREITVGMRFAGDVRSAKGVLLIARGQEVTDSLLERLRNFYFAVGVREPIRMAVPPRSSPSQPSATELVPAAR
jgi:response regulator RpfG family c-di-GMP phosphodiesterase